MKRIGIVFLSIVLISCTNLFLGDDPSNLAVDTFDEFWKGVDTTWPAFESKHVNWDSLYQVYRMQVDGVTNNNELIKILTNLLYSLKDTHTTIYPRDLPAISYYPKYEKNFYGLNWIEKNYPSRYSKNKQVAYGLITPAVGYIYIGSFAGDINEYEIIDTILQSFGKVDGIIIDVRSNTGGNSARSELIASRFANESRTYAYYRFRTGKQRNLLSDILPDNIDPANTYRFENKVAVLTNRYSYSATEDFVLMMKAFPQVIHLGDYTGGGSETRPLMKELPNGWTYRVSSKLLCGLDMQPIAKGIAPDIIIQTTKADSLMNKDSIIERAIAELKK